MTRLGLVVAGACFLEAGLIGVGVLEPDWVANVGVRVALGLFVVVLALRLRREG